MISVLNVFLSKCLQSGSTIPDVLRSVFLYSGFSPLVCYLLTRAKITFVQAEVSMTGVTFLAILRAIDFYVFLCSEVHLDDSKIAQI